uniref:CDPK n=1 Tax=Arundo donax TaxID=35708 RepID=A0A0A9FK14_ARUDO
MRMYQGKAAQYGLALAGVQEFTKIQMQAVPHGSPSCCTGISLPHHCRKLAVIDLPIIVFIDIFNHILKVNILKTKFTACL